MDTVKKLIVEVITKSGIWHFTGLDDHLGFPCQPHEVDEVLIKELTPEAQHLRYNRKNGCIEYAEEGWSYWETYIDAESIKAVAVEIRDVMVARHKVRHCCLSALDSGYSIDFPADEFSASSIAEYAVEWKRYSRNDPEEYIYYSAKVEMVHLTGGKYAFPVYEITVCVDEFGEWSDEEMHIIGWCVRDEDPFYNLPDVLYY